jgi:hypothetical protein
MVWISFLSKAQKYALCSIFLTEVLKENSGLGQVKLNE